jgi:hypothetical protein
VAATVVRSEPFKNLCRALAALQPGSYKNLSVKKQDAIQVARMGELMLTVARQLATAREFMKFGMTDQALRRAGVAGYSAAFVTVGHDGYQKHKASWRAP